METHCPWCGLGYGTAPSAHWCQAGQVTKFQLTKPKEPDNVIYKQSTGKEVPKTKLFDTEWTQFPVCPNCGAEDQDWWGGLGIIVQDGSEWHAYCDRCEQDYKVTACIDTTFRTEKE